MSDEVIIESDDPLEMRVSRLECVIEQQQKQIDALMTYAKGNSEAINKLCDSVVMATGM